MDLVASLPATPKAWLFNSPLAPHLDAFVAHLRRGRYATQTAKTHILGVAHFARWMTQCSLPVSLLNEQTTRQFMSNHLPRWNCPPPVLRLRTDLRAALGLLLVVLRQQGAVAQVAPPTGHIADELRRYDDHMRDARGLSSGTRRGFLRIAQRLLEHKFASGLVVISELQPSDLRQFIAKQLERVGTVSNAMALASALRSYLQYRTTCGDRVHGLLGVISSPAHWRLASLPRALKPDEVDRLLASFNSSVPSPKRGYAIVRCALDMGLRIGEVAGLQLRDIDWGAGTVTLKHTKSLRQDILPLPVVTGKALADYVLHERPKTTNQAVFVRVLAPRDQPIGVDGGAPNKILKISPVADASHDGAGLGAIPAAA